MSRKSATLQRIRITPEMKSQLEQLALEDKRTVSDYVRLVLERHLQSVECLRELVDEHGLMTEQAFVADAKKNIPRAEYASADVGTCSDPFCNCVETGALCYGDTRR